MIEISEIECLEKTVPRNLRQKYCLYAMIKILKYFYIIRSSSVRQIRAGNSERQLSKPTFQTNTVTHYNKFKKKVEKKFLEVGQTVMCIHNKEMATVRYIGHTDFAPGIWIGLELKKAIGESLSCL